MRAEVGSDEKRGGGILDSMAPPQEPPCGTAAAWRAVVASGVVPDARATFVLSQGSADLAGETVWILAVPGHPEYSRQVDAARCLRVTENGRLFRDLVVPRPAAEAGRDSDPRSNCRSRHQLGPGADRALGAAGAARPRATDRGRPEGGRAPRVGRLPARVRWAQAVVTCFPGRGASADARPSDPSRGAYREGRGR